MHLLINHIIYHEDISKLPDVAETKIYMLASSSVASTPSEHHDHGAYMLCVIIMKNMIAPSWGGRERTIS